MSVAPFYSRISDAIGPLLNTGTDLQTFLESKVVSLEAPQDLERHPEHLAGFLLAANLCARLYPRIRIVGPKAAVAECAALAMKINPLCEVDAKPGVSDGAIAWATSPRRDSTVSVAPAGWEVLLDQPESAFVRPTNILTSLAAACIGVGELFRSVFADFLATGRSGPSPAKLNILTIEDSSTNLPALPSAISIGRVHLAGAGAIGQAAIYALARVSARGTLIVVDPEQISLSNLQRYILTTSADVGASKCSLATRALRGSGVEVRCHESRWNDRTLEADGNIETVCAAVDTELVRIEIQSGLPRRIYNAWTQPADLGWSRHEDFGKSACLACLYWPDRPRPSQHELIARVIRQSELRVLGYLTHKLPVGQPIAAEQIPRIPSLPVPPDSASWVERSLLADIAESLQIPAAEIGHWKNKRLPDLYREGICGGALLRSEIAEVSSDMAVPLAHQSALAGVMLAAQLLIASSPELRPFRPAANEGRLNVLAGFPQIAIRPRQRTNGCLCSDSDFIERFNSKWT